MTLISATSARQCSFIYLPHLRPAIRSQLSRGPRSLHYSGTHLLHPHPDISTSNESLADATSEVPGSYWPARFSQKIWTGRGTIGRKLLTFGYREL